VNSMTSFLSCFVVTASTDKQIPYRQTDRQANTDMQILTDASKYLQIQKGKFSFSYTESFEVVVKVLMIIC
jgi:hypothetical protein